MLLRSALVSSFLFASTVLADRRHEDHQLRSNRVEQRTDAASDVVYSSKVAGAVWVKSDGTFNTITGTFTVPDASEQYGSVTVFVGIDGVTIQDVMLQTGIDIKVDEDGTSYQAWYKWLPEFSRYYSTITFTHGDTIKLTVSASSATKGWAKIDNLSTGQKEFQRLHTTHALRGQDAVWLVDDPSGPDSLVPFAKFGRVSFKDVVASGPSGAHRPKGATIWDIRQNGDILASTSIDGSDVTVVRHA